MPAQQRTKAQVSIWITRSHLPRIGTAATVDLLKQLIRIPSVNPAIEDGEGEERIATFIAAGLRKARLFHVSEQKVEKHRFNVLATLAGKHEGPSLMLNGHMDTVGTLGMKVKPYAPLVRMGRVYGRGSCDMKAALAAMMSAMVALAKSRNKLAGDVTFTAVVDEEHLSVGTTELIRRCRTDAAIVGEPTTMNIAIAHKGYAWLEIETIGRRAHGSVPEQGVDAIEKTAQIILQPESVRKRYRLKKHPLVGNPGIHASTIVGGSEWSTVPAGCLLRVERRLIPGENAQVAVNELKKVIEDCARRDKSLRARVRLVHHADSMEVREAPHMQVLRGHARRLGGNAKLVGVPYWTDAAILVNQAKIPTCIFGPGDIRLAHSPNEYVRLKDVTIAARVYAETAQTYCSKNSVSDSDV